ncbi:MAG: PaaI family thioesterase [Bacilli bacterium]|nr:PaaI family thioesterase [Bacilli bacterium]
MKVLKKQANSKDCFVCGTENPYGIHANFYNMEDLTCVALFQFDSKHQSYPERTHGGNITSIIDETIGRAVWCLDPNIWGCTIKLNMQYKKPVPYETPLMCVGKIEKLSNITFQGWGEIRTMDGEVLARGDAMYMRLSPQQISPTANDYDLVMNQEEESDIDEIDVK